MRATIYTEKVWIELGITAKDNFLKCLPPDENGEFDTIQKMTTVIRQKISLLDDANFPFSSVDKFIMFKKTMTGLKDGEFFMVTNDIVNRPRRCEQVEMLNNGKTIEEVKKISRDWKGD